MADSLGARIVWFGEKECQDSSLVGNKGANLAKLFSLGYNIPRGFCITAGHGVGYNKKFIKRYLPDAIRKLGFPLVVRSSSAAEDAENAAFAGIFVSVIGLDSVEAVVRAVRRVLASKSTPTAKRYAKEKGIDINDIGMGIVVQRLIEPSCAGVAFGRDPLTNKEVVTIEANYGLGETVVSGVVVPDYIQVDKAGNIRKAVVGTKKVKSVFKDGNSILVKTAPKEQAVLALPKEKARELARIVHMIEKSFALPQDIEWALKRNKFYVIQSRPITAFRNAGNKMPLFEKENYILSLWLRGVSIFVTDIHNDLYKRLEALFIIDNGMFKQYFTKAAYNRALEEGVQFYSKKGSFPKYEKGLSGHCNNFRSFFESNVRGNTRLSREMVSAFFDYTRTLCGEYTRMNFEFTDKAFTMQDDNPEIKRNLLQIGLFKEKIRNFMNMVLFEDGGYSDTLFSMLGRKFGLSPDIFESMTQKEILGLFDGKRPDKENVLRRQEAFVESYNVDGFYEGEDAKSVIMQFREEPIYSNIIKGQSASKGKVTGKVKVISVDYAGFKSLGAEIEKMPKGNILVAETTAPELMAACRKAAAIVTDMGGLMSHAAIISRELGIPCVVGTGNASKILKDDDSAEVDAYSGVIRVLHHGTQSSKDEAGQAQTGEFTRMWAEENHNYFDLEPSLLNFGIRCERKFGIGIRDGLMFGKGFHAEFYLPRKELMHSSEQGYRFLMDKAKFKMLLSEIDKANKEMQRQIALLLDADLEGLGAGGLWTLYSSYGKAMTDIFTCYSMTQHYRLARLEQGLFEFVKAKNAKRPAETVAELTAPMVKFNFTRGGNHLLKAFSETVGLESYKVDKGVANRKMYYEKRVNPHARNRLFRELKAPEDIRRTADILGRIAEERMKMRFVWMKTLYFNDIFFAEFKRRFNVSKSNLRMYDFMEIEGLALSGKTVPKGKLEDRKAGFLKILENGNIRTLYGRSAVRYMENATGSERIGALRGVPASGGRASGRVVVLSYRESEKQRKKLEKMRKGDIIVTEMTRPNILAACRKAGAIVTDEGGITSHAAIISREYGKPCIVGTGNATAVLKDGDIVEVDADNGVVTLQKQSRKRHVNILTNKDRSTS